MAIGEQGLIEQNPGGASNFVTQVFPIELCEKPAPVRYKYVGNFARKENNTDSKLWFWSSFPWDMKDCYWITNKGKHTR